MVVVAIGATCAAALVVNGASTAAVTAAGGVPSGTPTGSGPPNHSTARPLRHVAASATGRTSATLRPPTTPPVGRPRTHPAARQSRAPALRHVASARTASVTPFVSGPLRAPGGPFLYDAAGRVVILHGVDAVYKYAPFELFPAPGRPWNFDAADAAQIARLGFDVVRLGMTWAGLEPGVARANDPAICDSGVPGNPHQWSSAVLATYLQHLTQTVDLLGRYHIYTLLDMHQDIYSSAFGGEGAPPWAVCTGGASFVRPPGRWSRAYATAAVDSAFHTFWTNDAVGNLQGQFDRVWTAVATSFRNNPWIVGYDPFNEPFSRALGAGGDDQFGTELACFYLGRADAAAPAPGSPPLTCPPGDPAVGLVPRLLAADPTHLVFTEPDIFGRGIGPSTVGPMNLPRLVFNFHVYCGERHLNGNPTSLAACAGHEALTLAQRAADRAEMATPAQPGGPAWFMSEFGATSNVALLQQVTAAADQQLVGWSYWAWKYYDDPTGSADEALALPSGRLRPTVSVLSQTYAQAIAGRPVSMSFDPATGAFHLSYVPAPAVHAPTIVFVPVALHYPTGYCASVSGGTVVSAPDSSKLLVTNDPGAQAVQIAIVAHRCPGTAGTGTAHT